jgi:SNF2 family DNA or RNA helicase
VPARCVHIGDCESDIDELFCTAQELGTHFLVRSCVDRLAGDGNHTIAAEMDEVSVQGVHEVEVRDSKGRVGTAVVELKYRPGSSRACAASQFTSMLALIEAELARTGVPWLLLTGDTRDRETPVRRFQAGEVPLFLISLKAGGTGLNLTSADTVIHYDPWWNPAVEDQATDRTHRIGQNKSVFVHKLVALGAIEEKMETLKATKRELVSGILEDAGSGIVSALSEAEVEALFAPDPL